MSSPRPLKKRGNAALGRNYNSGEAVLELLLTTGTDFSLSNELTITRSLILLANGILNYISSS